MAVNAPTLALEHCLNHPKGWFAENALDCAAKFAAAITFAPVGGRVVHLNDAGEFEMGIRSTDMAIFLLNGEADKDVSNPGRSISGRFLHQPIGPTGVGSGLVATGGYELESSEFDTARDYVPGDLLTAAADNEDADVGGVLTNAGSGAGGIVEQYVDPVCGVVSGVPFLNEHEVNMLPFWPVFLPGEFDA